MMSDQLNLRGFEVVSKCDQRGRNPEGYFVNITKGNSGYVQIRPSSQISKQLNGEDTAIILIDRKASKLAIVYGDKATDDSQTFGCGSKSKVITIKRNKIAGATLGRKQVEFGDFNGKKTVVFNFKDKEK